MKILRNSILLLLVLTSGLVILARRAQPAPYSILLITIDSLRQDSLGLYGYDRDTSPTLDALAERSVVFDNAFAQAYWTATSHASLFTSLHPRAHGVFRNSVPLPEDHITLTEVLSPRGYKTGALVNVGLLDKWSDHQQGFTSYNIIHGYPEPDDENEGELIDDLVGDTMEWLYRHQDYQTFYWLHINHVHASYDPPYEFSDMFVDPQWDPGRKFQHYRQMREVWRTEPLTEDELAWTKSQYDAEIRFTDSQLDRLFSWMEESGFMERTIIVITNDHGEAFTPERGHYVWGHGHRLYDEVVRAPLIIWLPNSLREEIQVPRVAALTQEIDIAPTLLDLAGIPIPATFRGQSLRPLWTGQATKLYDDLLLGVGVAEEPLAVRTDRWKYISHDDLEELYYLPDDPKEVNNLATAHPEQTAWMRALMEQRRDAVPRYDQSEFHERRSDIPEEIQKILRDAGYLEDEPE